MAVPSGVVKTRSKIRPGRPGCDARLKLLSTDAAEHRDRLGRQGDRTPAEVRLRLPKRHALSGEALRHLLDVRRRAIEIDVAPSEPEQLAATQPGVDRGPHERPDAVGIRGRQERIDIVGRDGEQLAPTGARRLDGIERVPDEQLPADGVMERCV